MVSSMAQDVSSSSSGDGGWRGKGGWRVEGGKRGRGGKGEGVQRGEGSNVERQMKGRRGE